MLNNIVTNRIVLFANHHESNFEGDLRECNLYEIMLLLFDIKKIYEKLAWIWLWMASGVR